MHVHLPTGDWVCGCVGHYADSIERYFGSRPRAALGRGLRRAVRAAGPGGRAARVGRAGQELDNAEIARICSESGGRFVGFGSVDPNREDALERLARFPALGLRGPEAAPDDAGLRPGRRPLPAVLRRRRGARPDRCSPTPGTSGLGAGEPGGQGLRIDLARPILLDRIAARHPHMQIVLAHVGWPWHLEAVAMALHKSNVYLDIWAGSTATCPTRSSARSRAGCAASSASGPTTRCSTPRPAWPSSTGSSCRRTSRSAVLRDNAAALLGL